MRATELSLQQLHAFKHVIEQGGYAAAARAMGLSVPTVWQQIQAVERLYGVPLFQKQGRAIQPTKVAQRLYEQVATILASVDSTFDLVREDQQSLDSVTLVTGVRMLMEDLAVPLAHFRKQFDCRVVIRNGNNRIAEELVISGEADLALTLEAGYQQSSSLIHYEPAYEVDFLAIAAKSHPFAAAQRIQLRDLVKHPLIVTMPGTHGRDALDQALHRERLQAKIAVETDNSGFTIACARAGLGVGILAGRSDGELCRRLVSKSLRRQLGQRQIVFMWRKGRNLTTPLLQLVELVKRQWN